MDARLKVFGTDHDMGTIEQMANCMENDSAVSGVLCADGHLGYSQPVGGVIAYDGKVSISGVGYDIACGNKAIKLDVHFNEIKDKIPTILADIGKNISFGVGRVNETKVEAAVLDQRWPQRINDLRQKAANQLGTIGSGNHYVDVFRDEEGFVWIGVHFGSRGLGHTTATRYLKEAGGKDGIMEPPTLVDVGSELGGDYIQAMHIAGDYAYAGRDWVCEEVRKIIGGTVIDSVHNHHNYAWFEEHGGKHLWVVRKGATPAMPGQRGFVGGSMGDDAVIIHGRYSEANRNSLYSTVHGAGRLYSRTRAKKELSKDVWDQWLKNRGVYLLGGDLDESPMAYRRLNAVLFQHAETIEVEHTLTPLAVAMAGKGQYDPWKD